jgi:hypothetical protein
MKSSNLALRITFLAIFIMLLLPLTIHGHDRKSGQDESQSVKTKCPRMAPLDQYLMERNADIALTRSAAPSSISQDADVFILGDPSW